MALVMTADEALDLQLASAPSVCILERLKRPAWLTRSRSFGFWAIGPVPFNSTLISYTIQGKGQT